MWLPCEMLNQILLCVLLCGRNMADQSTHLHVWSIQYFREYHNFESNGGSILVCT